MDEMILQAAGGKFPLTEYLTEEGGRKRTVLHAGDAEAIRPTNTP